MISMFLNWLKPWRTLKPSTEAVISKRPYLSVHPNFLSLEECSHFIQLAQDKLQPSIFAQTGDWENKAFVHARTSSGFSFKEHDADPTLSAISERIAHLTQTRVAQGEPFHLLHYNIGQEYKPHYDYFDPAQENADFYLQHGGQRLGSFLIYLSDVEQGGETTFPKLKIKIKPQRGLAVFFRNLKPDNSLEPRALHGAAPVIAGEKWSVTRWIRLNDYYEPPFPS